MNESPSGAAPLPRQVRLAYQPRVLGHQRGSYTHGDCNTLGGNGGGSGWGWGWLTADFLLPPLQDSMLCVCLMFSCLQICRFPCTSCSLLAAAPCLHMALLCGVWAGLVQVTRLPVKPRPPYLAPAAVAAFVSLPARSVAPIPAVGNGWCAVVRCPVHPAALCT